MMGPMTSVICPCILDTTAPMRCAFSSMSPMRVYYAYGCYQRCAAVSDSSKALSASGRLYAKTCGALFEHATAAACRVPANLDCEVLHARTSWDRRDGVCCRIRW